MVVKGRQARKSNGGAKRSEIQLFHAIMKMCPSEWEGNAKICDIADRVLWRLKGQPNLQRVVPKDLGQVAEKLLALGGNFSGTPIIC